LGIPVLLNLLISLVELLGGLLSNSLALLSDAFHNFMDTSSLVVAYVSEKIALRPSDRKRTFGYKRAEILGALLNTLFLFVIGGILLKTAVERLGNPQEVRSGLMLVVAAVGLLANVVTALWLSGRAKENLNVRTAFVHVMGDAFSSVLVIGGSLLIMRFQWLIIDAVFAFLIALYVLVQGVLVLRRVIRVLMQSVPEHIPVQRVREEILSLKEVEDVHHLHVWSMNEKDVYFEAHIKMSKANMRKLESVKRAIKDLLRSEYHISHATLEFEFKDCGKGVCHS
jgi:cobalt-zinc-cadmium efflux system protein